MIWTLLANASTAQFTAQVLAPPSDWLGSHPIWGFFAGFVALIFTAAYPDIKDKPPLIWMKLPKTLHERIRAIEHEHLPKLDSCDQIVTDLKQAVDDLNISARLGRLEADTQTCTALANGHSINLTNLQDSVFGGHRQVESLAIEIAKRLDGMDGHLKPLLDFSGNYPQLRMLLNADVLNIVQRQRIFIGQMPGFLKFLSEANSLLNDVETSILNWQAIRQRYGSLSPVVRQPFSNWRPPSHSIDPLPDDSIRDGEQWARSLEDYAQKAQAFRARWYGGAFFSGELFQLVVHWRVQDSDISSDGLERLLREHYGALVSLRDDHAAMVCSEAARVTTS